MKRAWHVLRATIDKWSKDGASAQAAALAYYSAFSIAPLILIAIAVAGAIFGEQAATGEIQRQLTGLLGDDAAKAVEALVVSAHRGGHGQLAAIIGTVALVLGATGVFVQLQDSLNLIWRASPAKTWMGLWSFLKKRLLSLAMVLAIGFLLLTSLIASAILSALGNYMSGVLPEWQVTLVIVNQVVSLAVIGCLFAVMFRYLPDHHVLWHAAMPPPRRGLGGASSPWASSRSACISVTARWPRASARPARWRWSWCGCTTRRRSCFSARR